MRTKDRQKDGEREKGEDVARWKGEKERDIAMESERQKWRGDRGGD